MLTVDSSDLDVVFVCDSLELLFVVHKFWEADVDGCSQSSSKIGWTGGDITQVFIVRKLAHSFDVGCSSRKPIKNLLDACSILHGDNSKLIFLVDPYKESLCIIVEDTSSTWPVSV